MPRVYKHEAQEDGWSKWETPRMAGYRLICCDCGLSHEMDFRIIRVKPLDEHTWEGDEEILDDPTLRVQFRCSRHNRSTAQVRRHMKAVLSGVGR